MCVERAILFIFGLLEIDVLHNVCSGPLLSGRYQGFEVSVGLGTVAIGELAGIAHDFHNILIGIEFCDLFLLQHSADDSSFVDIIQIPAKYKT
uniref:Uncharacterized protein n=1 Tax=Onchocerca volvulus TaxID=6282 RepID=A0A8R1TLH5_ONCVO